MQKTIIVGDKEVKLKTNGLAPLIYKKEFKRDFFADIHEATKKDCDIEIIYNLVWIFAKIAEPEIPPLYEWLSEFETFPVMKYFNDIIDLTVFCITAKKPSQKKTKAAKKD